ncbi:ankyrin repeat domain-containing protein [Candidatus Micrarchaeota archaeon]|nr:ankyrin repeat domain-containing protein [Candidatus Micrarchaeota archaeon]
MGAEKKTSFRKILEWPYRKYLYFKLPDELKSLEKPNEILLKSAKIGSNIGIKYALLIGADVNAEDKDGWTALMWAAKKGYAETVKLLIEKEADVNAKDSYNTTTLMLASDNGYLKIAELLIEKGVDVNAKNEDGWTALILAARYKHIEMAELLIKKEADVNAKDNLDGTVLTHAAYTENTEIAELLIENRADVIYICKKYTNSIHVRNTINQIAEEKPELFTKEQRFMFEIYSNPENISPDKKGEIITVLRELTKKGLITKEQSLELFTNLQRVWNENIPITTNKGIRKPGKELGKNRIRRLVQ